MADLSLKIENDSRVEMKIYTLQDKIELSFKVDGKDTLIPQHYNLTLFISS